MKKYYFKSVIAIILVAVVTVNLLAENVSVVHAKMSERPRVNTDTKQDYKENEGKGGTWSSRDSSVSVSGKVEKTKDKKWDNRKKNEKARESGVKSEKKVKKNVHRGSVFGGIKNFLSHIIEITFGNIFNNECIRLVGEGFRSIGKFLKHNESQILGALQFIGGVVQLALAIGLCSTGAGAILGIPMLLHAVADMAQGGSIVINAVLGKKVLSEANFMEETYKAVGGFIGNIIGDAEGRKIGKKIASGTFVIADIAMAFATPEGAAKLASKFKSVNSMSDAMKIFGSMFGKSMSGFGKKGTKACSDLSGLVKSTWNDARKLAGEFRDFGKTFAETWNNYPKDKRIALSSNGAGEFEKLVDKFTGTIRETTKKIQKGSDKAVDSVSGGKIAKGGTGVQNQIRLIPGKVGVVTGGNSTTLEKNMMEAMGLRGSTKWSGYQAQHIIPAQMAQNPIIKKIGMNLDDATNGVFLRIPGNDVSTMARHKGYHSVYNDVVELQLSKMNINQSVDVLQKEVFELQTKLRYLQEKGLPLYKGQGATVDMWIKALEKLK